MKHLIAFTVVALVLGVYMATVYWDECKLNGHTDRYCWITMMR